MKTWTRKKAQDEKVLEEKVKEHTDMLKHLENIRIHSAINTQNFKSEYEQNDDDLYN